MTREKKTCEEQDNIEILMTDFVDNYCCVDMVINCLFFYLFKKKALVVRYLTHRFIGDYDQNLGKYFIL